MRIGERKTLGQVMINLLEAYGIEMVFGIPGVHTVELYRGLAQSSIRHITPRHELSAGFMADGYARMSGKPAACLLITGPGLTNAITAMAQARADSIPMMVISGVNRAEHHGHEEGHLHELPDQIGLIRSVALFSHSLKSGQDLEQIMQRAFVAMTAGRPGPVHIEIPLDIMSEHIDAPQIRPIPRPSHVPSSDALDDLAALCKSAQRPVILVGGGAVRAEASLQALVERLDAPFITTINARGMLSGHELRVPASPSLPAVRAMLADADLVIAAGTQLGPTDYDMYVDGAFPDLKKLVRIDVDPYQATRGALPDYSVVADCRLVFEGLVALLGSHKANCDGKARAQATRMAAYTSLSPDYRQGADLIEAIGRAVPECVMVGDSTQLVYAGNSYAEIRRNVGWFNSSVGFGSLGYGAPAAIGAQLADPATAVICITGDGGFQFCLSELGTAMDEETPVIFLVWNNSGYREIERYMIDEKIPPIGVTPSAPNFVAVAAAYGMAGERIGNIADIPAALSRARDTARPYLVEFSAP